MLIMDLLLFSSDPTLAVSSRMIIGYSIIVVLGVSIVLSQGGLMVSVFKSMCHRCKLRRIRSANKKRMEERKKLGLT